MDATVGKTLKKGKGDNVISFLLNSKPRSIFPIHYISTSSLMVNFDDTSYKNSNRNHSQWIIFYEGLQYGNYFDQYTSNEEVLINYPFKYIFEVERRIQNKINHQIYD